MKILFKIQLCLLGVIFSNLAEAQRKLPRNHVKPVEIEDLIFSGDLWVTNIIDFQKDSKNKKFRFQWQTAQKQGLRSSGLGFKFLNIKAGECLIKSSKDGNLKGLSISFYNKGDDGNIGRKEYKKLVNDLKTKISTKLEMKPKFTIKKVVVTLDSNIWKKGDTSYQLESSINQSGIAEFLRLRVMSTRTARVWEKTAGRSSLTRNVVKVSSTGAVYIDNVPMVDQGAKGYCACASAARIYQYYGRTTDQHEIAQIADSSAKRGTSISDMINSLKKVTKHLNTRVNILYEYPKGLTKKRLKYREFMSGQNDMMRDFNAYQKLAKKKGAKSILIKGKKEYAKFTSKDVESLPLSKMLQHVDAKLFREVMMRKSSFSRFKSKIREYIKRGIPVAWCVKLGLFPEKGLPQISGGHMRLIIGYNDKTKELIYSDSWGAGHAKKSMDVGEAFSMTNALLVLPPTK